MNSRWSEPGAREAIARWGPTHGEMFALRLYSARLLGADADLVLHGGGNVSLKAARSTPWGDSQAVLFVKASGFDLATLEPEGLPAVDLACLRRLRAVESMDDAALQDQLHACCVQSASPLPSIETFLHAFLPHPVVDHTHADAVLALTNQVAGTQLVRDALEDRTAIVEYVRPGLELARVVADALDRQPGAAGVVLMQHGLVTFGDGPRESYERHIALVHSCEEFLRRRTAHRQITVPALPGPCASRVERLAPILRGLLATSTEQEDQPYRRAIMDWRTNGEVLSLLGNDQAAGWAADGPLTGDHLIHARRFALWLEEPETSDDDVLRERLRGVLEGFRCSYADYVQRHGGVAIAEQLQPAVVLVPGLGILCWGPTKAAAQRVADVAEHTLRVKALADAIGRFQALPDEKLYDIEFRPLQRRKLKVAADPLLAGQVVFVSGGAGAIGAAIAAECLDAGAHVALADVDEERLATVVGRLGAQFDATRVVGVPADVTDGASVRIAMTRTVETFGGLDVIVPNAGVAHVAPLETLAVDDFRRVMEVNATGYLVVIQEGVRVLKRQGLGGNIVINASKNVFAPGKDFGAYSASKAAGHQLGRVAALELAPLGIRVNMINADAVFGDEENPSSLWQSVGPQRAESKGLSPSELPEYYRQRNLLKVRVHGRHVGRAVVFFASNATPTTGATLPVDGGLPEAFPR